MEGIVEVSFLGHWFTVCGSSWDMRDATVACHQLGYTAAKNIYSSRRSGQNRLSSFHCTGYEANLTQCSHSGLVGYCSSGKAGVMCSGK